MHENWKGYKPASRAISKAECAGELSLGTSVGVQPTDTASVSTQLLDLREAGFAFPDKKRPVRLLVGYQVGGSRSWLDGDRTVLAGDQYLGMSNHESAWKDGELHLQTHFVLDGDRLEKGEGPLTIYDVVVLWTKVNQE